MITNDNEKFAFLPSLIYTYLVIGLKINVY